MTLRLSWWVVNYAIVENRHGEDDVDGRAVSPSISSVSMAGLSFPFNTFPQF